jgi:hypothetical protein
MAKVKLRGNSRQSLTACALSEIMTYLIWRGMHVRRTCRRDPGRRPGNPHEIAAAEGAPRGGGGADAGPRHQGRRHPWCRADCRGRRPRRRPGAHGLCRAGGDLRPAGRAARHRSCAAVRGAGPGRFHRRFAAVVRRRAAAASRNAGAPAGLSPGAGGDGDGTYRRDARPARLRPHRPRRRRGAAHRRGEGRLAQGKGDPGDQHRDLRLRGALCL